MLARVEVSRRVPAGGGEPRQQPRTAARSYPRRSACDQGLSPEKNVPTLCRGPLAPNSITAAQGITIVRVPPSRVADHAWWPVVQVAARFLEKRVPGAASRGAGERNPPSPSGLAGEVAV